MKFELRLNEELEGYDIIELNGIESDEGFEDSVVATFYNKNDLIKYLQFLNQ